MNEKYNADTNKIPNASNELNGAQLQCETDDSRKQLDIENESNSVDIIASAQQLSILEPYSRGWKIPHMQISRVLLLPKSDDEKLSP